MVEAWLEALDCNGANILDRSRLYLYLWPSDVVTAYGIMVQTFEDQS